MELTLRPEIVLTDKAQGYLRRAGIQNLYLEDAHVKQCCIPLIVPPLIHKGIPAKPENFIPLKFNGWTIYYEKSLRGPKIITIDVQSYVVAKTLIVRDWPVGV